MRVILGLSVDVENWRLVWINQPTHLPRVAVFILVLERGDLAERTFNRFCVLNCWFAYSSKLLEAQM